MIEAIIGLEIHAQLLTNSKMFCYCPVQFGDEPNSNVCPTCLGLPGALPVVNRQAVELALRVGLALKCRINTRSFFERKNYFYPDLPKGYQISQHASPLAEHGKINLRLNSEQKEVRIKRVHLEEDAGKSIHLLDKERCLLDFNRCGIPLVEIITEPDFNHPCEAVEFFRLLRSILMYLGVCNGNMEQGSLRCDANISVRRKGENKFGPKTELKNLNSFRFLEQALWYELNRQEECLIKGERIEQDTRLWDERQKITIPIRTKEETKDYRYFPEPDLGPLEIEQEWIKKVAESLPELPNERRERLIKEYGLPLYDATLLTAHKEVADFFERCVKTLSQPKLASNFIMTEVLKEVKFEGLRAYFPIAPEEISELLALMERGIISGNIAKQVFCEMKATKTRAKEIIEKKKLLQINDDSEIERVCKKVLSKYPGEVSRYQKGKKRVLDFFVGQVMKETQKRANPKKTRDILLRLLG